jgi:hypothetical protein
MNLHVPQSLPARAEAEHDVVAAGDCVRQSNRRRDHSGYALGGPENDQAKLLY